MGDDVAENADVSNDNAETTAATEAATAVAPEPPGATTETVPAVQSASLAAPGPIRPTPLPTGALLFGELASAFVDGPRLLRFLGDRRHTGALVDMQDGRRQYALLYEGAVVAMVGDTDTRRLDRLNLPTPASSEEHQLRVVAYRPEIVLALAQLVNLPERFARMHGSFVDLPALVAYLGRERASGAIRVTTSRDVGVILMRSGDVLGAYTRERPDLEDPDVVYPLGRDADAEIDVHTGTIQLPPPSVPAAEVA
jgi:hypothetical protein